MLDLLLAQTQICCQQQHYSKVKETLAHAIFPSSTNISKQHYCMAKETLYMLDLLLAQTQAYYQ